MPEKIHIKIIDNHRKTLCQVECSSDWSQSDVQAQMKTYLQEKFGDQIIVDYSDIEDSKQQLKGANKFPLLIVNGHIRLSGPFDMKQLLDIIETQLELGMQDK
jgi:hypothetical protein